MSIGGLGAAVGHLTPAECSARTNNGSVEPRSFTQGEYGMQLRQCGSQGGNLLFYRPERFGGRRLFASASCLVECGESILRVLNGEVTERTHQRAVGTPYGREVVSGKRGSNLRQEGGASGQEQFDGFTQELRVTAHAVE